MHRVMLDLETLGTDPGAAILSIGAVEFSLDGLGEQFERNVDLASCKAAGLSIDPGTLDWWLERDDSVQDVLTGGIGLTTALHDFMEFYSGADEIWAFSPSFDCAILGQAYEAAGLIEPWDYRDQRDCRTLVNLPIDVDVEREGNEHDALDDAIFQAREAVAILQELEEV